MRAVLNMPDAPADVLALLGERRIVEAAQLLENRAQKGDLLANVALARLQLYCGKLVPDETDERAAPNGTGNACEQADFDANAINRRLRAAANAGDAASLYQVGLQSGDLLERRRSWISAAMLDYVPAQVGLVDLLSVEGAERTRDRSREGADFWVAVAANASPAAKTSFAYCRLAGCNGQPADAAAALDLIRSAAQLGDAQGIQSLATSRAVELDMPNDERLAWAQFYRRLLEEGCYGEIGYEDAVKASDAALSELERRLSPFEVAQARTLADSTWQQYADGARRAQRCN